jgi:hypothetical protein
MGNAKWAKWDNKSVNVVISAVKGRSSLNSSSSTHPDFAQTLVDPLFALAQRGWERCELKKPSLPLAEERVVQRSADRVSQPASQHHYSIKYYGKRRHPDPMGIKRIFYISVK